MLTYAESQAALLELDVAARADRRERVPLGAARGRVLATDVAIDRDQPGFDRATMDGFAVVPDGDRLRFTVRGTVLAGQVHGGALAAGDVQVHAGQDLFRPEGLGHAL